ncbi:MAG: response regulator, partial [Lachnospiraceae bacterium]|nr:response regulator [Lachnospiraceae bacterium]
MKILMIEDDLGLNRGISFALAQEGYEVVTAENMEKGLKLFEMEHPDAILLDLNLPDGDGIQLCQ